MAMTTATPSHVPAPQVILPEIAYQDIEALLNDIKGETRKKQMRFFLEHMGQEIVVSDFQAAFGLKTGKVVFEVIGAFEILGYTLELKSTPNVPLKETKLKLIKTPEKNGNGHTSIAQVVDTIPQVIETITHPVAKQAFLAYDEQAVDENIERVIS
jgi:hypothetical protein